MIRPVPPADRPWRPRPDPRRRVRRLPTRVLLGTARARVLAFLESRRRPRRFAEVATAPGLSWMPRSILWRALRVLVDRGDVQHAYQCEVYSRRGFRHGDLYPVFWHPAFTFDHVEPVAPEGKGAGRG